SHVLFRAKEGYEMKGLPKFDDLTRYDIREKEELELWQLEVRRLAEMAKSEDPPSLEGDPEWFGRADSDGYNNLHRLALQVQYAMDVVIHDNELVLLEHHPQIANEKSWEMAHRRICRTFDQEKGTIRYERTIRIKKHNDEAYHALVNYITAVLIRVLLRSMTGKFWVENCVTVLAKFAAKFKVVGADLPLAFEKTLSAHEDFQIRVSQTPEARGVIPPAQSAAGEGDDHIAKQQKALREDIDTSGARYFIEMDTFRHPLGMIIQSAIADLAWNEEFGQTADIFETSAVVYDTGFPNRRTQLCQERDGSIGAAAERRDINFAGVAFQIGFEIWGTLSSSSDDPIGENYTTLTWSRKPYSKGYDKLKGNDKLKGDDRLNGDDGLNGDAHISQKPLRQSRQPDPEIRMTAMADVIAALVPYLMYCGSFASALSGFTKLAVLISDPSNPVRYYKQKAFLSVARMHTSAYERSKKPNSALIAQTVFETDISRRARLGEPNVRLRDELEKVIGWTIDEKAITIQHTWYTLISLLACAVLIAGGVALIAIGERAKGVDPSNLTALAWAAAGFSMVFFKSRRVQDWPWRDFLRGRIVCRSVSEVQSVTGMDPQTLMAILLRLESRVLLKTRGPFNTLFARKAEDGFSIDVPLLTSTVVDGGHIFVRVDSMSGPALVGLRAKNWGSYESISPKDYSPNGEGFVCRDFLDAGWYRGHGEGEEKALPLYTICTNELHWYRVRGVFSTRALLD
ncbi:hypothetical protein IMZ48_01800, partial [Candidatus Bathyarchaeota archaeon]|nr:hypothetical protein [Candidatus Bathyarchaeota archaeon]